MWLLKYTFFVYLIAVTTLPCRACMCEADSCVCWCVALWLNFSIHERSCRKGPLILGGLKVYHTVFAGFRFVLLRSLGPERAFSEETAICCCTQDEPTSSTATAFGESTTSSSTPFPSTHSSTRRWSTCLRSVFHFVSFCFVLCCFPVSLKQTSVV